MKHYYLLLLLSVFCLKGICQQVVRYEEFDYHSDVDVSKSSIEKFDSRIGLKITNVNKKLVVINKNVERNSFNEEMPSMFEVFSKAKLPPASEPSSALGPGTSFLSVEQISNARITEPIRNKLINLNEVYNKIGNTIFENNSTLAAFGEVYKRLKNVLQYQSNLLLLQEDCNLKFNEIRSQVANRTKETFSKDEMQLIQADKILLNDADYTKNKAIIDRYLSTINSEGQENYNKVSVAFTQTKKDELTKSVSTIKSGILEAIALLEKLPNRQTDRNIIAILKTLRVQKSNFELGKELSDSFEKFSKIDVVKLNSDIEAFNGAGKKELFAVYDYFTESNWIYYVEPQTIDKDLTILTVNILPKDNVPCTPLARSYELRIRAKSGLKVDFSTGLFTNFGGKGFMDQSYRYEEVSGQPEQYRIIRNESKNAIFPSVGGLMHFYKRSGKDFNLAGTFGLSTKDLEKMNYHLGGSAIFGYSQRFIISTGVTLTKATLIDDKYVDGQIIYKTEAPNAIPTATFNRIGFFAAFTYNLSSK